MVEGKENPGNPDMGQKKPDEKPDAATTKKGIEKKFEFGKYVPPKLARELAKATRLQQEADNIKAKDQDNPEMHRVVAINTLDTRYLENNVASAAELPKQNMSIPYTTVIKALNSNGELTIVKSANQSQQLMEGPVTIYCDPEVCIGNIAKINPQAKNKNEIKVINITLAKRE